MAAPTVPRRNGPAERVADHHAEAPRPSAPRGRARRRSAEASGSDGQEEAPTGPLPGAAPRGTALLASMPASPAMKPSRWRTTSAPGRDARDGLRLAQDRARRGAASLPVARPPARAARAEGSTVVRSTKRPSARDTTLEATTSDVAVAERRARRARGRRRRARRDRRRRRRAAGRAAPWSSSRPSQRTARPLPAPQSPAASSHGRGLGRSLSAPSPPGSGRRRC